MKKSTYKPATCPISVYLDNLPKCGQVFSNRQLFSEMCHETIPYFRILNGTDQYLFFQKCHSTNHLIFLMLVIYSVGTVHNGSFFVLL